MKAHLADLLQIEQRARGPIWSGGSHGGTGSQLAASAAVIAALIGGGGAALWWPRARRPINAISRWRRPVRLEAVNNAVLLMFRNAQEYGAGAETSASP